MSQAAAVQKAAVRVKDSSSTESAAAAQEVTVQLAVQWSSAEMEFNRDQQLSLASLHLARTINEESSEVTELFFTARMYNMCYRPQIHALIDERMVRV